MLNRWIEPSCSGRIAQPAPDHRQRTARRRAFAPASKAVSITSALVSLAVGGGCRATSCAIDPELTRSKARRSFCCASLAPARIMIRPPVADARASRVWRHRQVLLSTTHAVRRIQRMGEMRARRAGYLSTSPLVAISGVNAGGQRPCRRACHCDWFASAFGCCLRQVAGMARQRYPAGAYRYRLVSALGGLAGSSAGIERCNQAAGKATRG